MSGCRPLVVDDDVQFTAVRRFFLQARSRQRPSSDDRSRRRGLDVTGPRIPETVIIHQGWTTRLATMREALRSALYASTCEPMLARLTSRTRRGLGDLSIAATLGSGGSAPRRGTQATATRPFATLARGPLVPGCKGVTRRTGSVEGGR